MTLLSVTRGHLHQILTKNVGFTGQCLCLKLIVWHLLFFLVTNVILQFLASIPNLYPAVVPKLPTSECSSRLLRSVSKKLSDFIQSYSLGHAFFWTISYSSAFTLYHHVYCMLTSLKRSYVLIADNDLAMYRSQFLELRQRLLYAEKENNKRSHELSSALDEIKRIVAKRMNSTTNHTGLYA